MGTYIESRDDRWHLIKKKKKIKGIMYESIIEQNISHVNGWQLPRAHKLIL